MPPSALARLTDLEIESPWTFEVSSARNPTKKTHAGVLEFIADEGNVHLPAWVGFIHIYILHHSDCFR